MILPFSTLFPWGDPTHFVEAIHVSLRGKFTPLEVRKWKSAHNKKFGNLPTYLGDFSDSERKPKLHTIRVDEKSRWREGNLIHFTINNRQSNHEQFAPVVQVLGVEKIYINGPDQKIYFLEGGKGMPHYFTSRSIKELAINDGFESADQFWQWFGEVDGWAKIIHWTDEVRYTN